MNQDVRHTPGRMPTGSHTGDTKGRLGSRLTKHVEPLPRSMLAGRGEPNETRRGYNISHLVYTHVAWIESVSS